jgi:1-acyl-sn-glycerol-3-phosphate acyltransferase
MLIVLCPPRSLRYPPMVRTLTAIFRTFVFIPLFFLYTLMRATQVIFIGKQNRNSPKIERIIQTWSALFLRIPPIEISVKGAERVDPAQRYVVVSNHTSNFDIPVLFRSIPTPIRFLAKKELYKIPLLGPGMDAAGIVKVDRGGARSTREAINTAARETYRRGYSLMVFAEGTRSRTGDMADFHKGAARLAMDNGADLLPVVISGTFDVNPPGSIFIYPGQVRVTILDPIRTADYTVRDITPLTVELRERMNTVYEALRDEHQS